MCCAHCLAGRYQRHDGNGISEWQHLLRQYNITIICNSKNLSLVFHWYGHRGLCLRLNFFVFAFLCFGHILFSSFTVDSTALLTEQIGQNDPKPQINFFKGSVATLCRWSGHINNCCVASSFSILCVKFYGKRSVFVGTTVEQKTWTFLGHGVVAHFNIRNFQVHLPVVDVADTENMRYALVYGKLFSLARYTLCPSASNHFFLVFRLLIHCNQVCDWHSSFVYDNTIN